MKKTVFFAAVVIAGLFIVFQSSCKKDDPVPDFPQLIGSWGGTTSQGASITFYVDNIKGILYVESYKVTVYTSTGYQEYQAINSTGIAAISNKAFRIPLGTGSSGPAFIDGIFDLTTMTLSGSWAVYAAGNSVDIITGTYLTERK
jgi:hypothetical protein